MKLLDRTRKFNTEDKCLKYLEALRWPMGVRCITCGSQRVSRVRRKTKTKNRRTRLYQCLEKNCAKQFSTTVGTIFHDSHLPLSKWFIAIATISRAEKALSIHQLERCLAINYRTARLLRRRILEAMNQDERFHHRDREWQMFEETVKILLRGEKLQRALEPS